MIVNVNGTTYDMGKEAVKVCLDMAKKALLDSGAEYAIVGLQKKGFLDMRRDIFFSEVTFNKAKAGYRAIGFIVHCAVKGEK